MSDLCSDLRLFIINTGADTRLEVGGDLDIAAAAELSDHLDILIDDGTGPVHVDMSMVTFCDSSTLAVLVDAWQRLGEADRPLRVVNPSACVSRLLQITGLEELFLDHERAHS